MKINKKTTIACALAIFLCGISIALLEMFTPEFTSYDTICNIVFGVFSSFIVSFVISIIGYFHERAIIIERTENNIKSLYINMCVLSKIIGDTLQQIYTTTDLAALPFNNISGLSALNVEFLNNMGLGLFNSFYTHGRLAKVYSSLIEFQQVAYNIKNISMNLHAQALEHNNHFLSIRNNESFGMQTPPMVIQNLDALKNLINIKTAKLHEYVTGQSLELEKIAKAFYEYINSKQSWENIKSNLLIQVEDIVKK